MHISIIIPTYNASKYLPDLFNRLNTQTVKYSEIIVIDSFSMDKTIDIAKSFGAVTIAIPKEEFDHGKTRNLGASRAAGNILVYMTQDAIPTDEFSLQNLIKSFNRYDDIAAVYGRQLPSSNISPFSAHLRLFNYPDTSYIRVLNDKNKYGIKTIFFSNSFSAYRREMFKEIGGFKENLIFGEDTLIAAKLLMANYKIAYAADAQVCHSHDYTAFQEFKRYFDIGVMHKTENWLIKEFGGTGGEGKKYIKSGLAYLMKHNRYNLIPSFIFINALKYFGYNLGLGHSKIPRNLAYRLSMNKTWWRKNCKTCN